MKHFLLDTIGILFILISPLLGWIPGPGGIPLFLAGLGLLAINHSWAKRWIKSIENKGSKFVDMIFVDHKLLKATYDILSLLLIFLGIYYIYHHTTNLILSLSVLALFTGVGIFLGNRKRLKSFSEWIKKR